mgnify:CR=1 FL=1
MAQLTLMILSSLLIFMQSSHADTIKVLHYNIKELDSQKLNQSNEQVKNVKSITDNYDFDILSINELQYDLTGVPNDSFKTDGENLDKLAKLLGLKPNVTVFGPANTGMNARIGPNGEYYRNANSAEARSHADQLNFGTMPGQYSTGAMLINGKLLSTKIISKLKWKDFNSSADFSEFKTADGKSIPEDMLLFDKNFTHMKIEFKAKEVHVLLLHTVPSYYFGNKFSINDYRNAEQLRFMEWYMTGSTDFKVQLKSITPISEKKYIIAVGDLNVAPTESGGEGSLVINNLIKKATPWIKKSAMNFTSESSGYRKDPNRFMLDYIFTSKLLKPVKGKIIHPNFEWIDAECAGEEESKNPNPNIYAKILFKKGTKDCYAYTRHDYVTLKKASDHYPIYGEFEFL